MLIDLIRHGEPVGGRCYRGQRDDPLSEKGWEQMWSAVHDRGSWDNIITSPLQRCAAFAQALSQRLELPVQIDERLKEVGVGAWEGQTPDQLRRTDPDAFRRFFEDPVANRPPGAEPLDDFYARVVAGWSDIVRSRAGAHTLLVGHAGVIRAVLCHVLAMPLTSMYRIQVQNASVTRVRVEADDTAVLLSHGT
jgi:alpha-ribazole phosphatase